MPFLNYKPLKLYLRVFLRGLTVAMVTYCVKKMMTMCSPLIGQFFDTMIVASSDRVVKMAHPNINAGNCI